MNKYVQDVYTLADKGFTDRPSWVNKTVRVLTGFEFLSKIGFGVGTAARNTMSGLYFIQGITKVILLPHFLMIQEMI